jgi:hypothetical protein
MNAQVRRLALGSAAVVLAAALAACSGQASGAGATSEPPATTVAPTPTPTPTPSVIDLTADTFVPTISQASAALPAMSATFDMVTTAEGQTVTATGAMRTGADGKPEMTMTMSVPSMTAPIEMRLVGGIYYMNMGSVTGGLFVAVDPSDPSIGLPMPTDVDPASGAKDISSAIVSVKKVGEPEAIGGVPTQAFDDVVDLSKVTGATRQSLDSAQQQATAAGATATIPSLITYHYWIDAHGLVRRVSDEVLGTSTQMTFSGWGEAVDIQAPPADQIANLDTK